MKRARRIDPEHAREVELACLVGRDPVGGSVSPSLAMSRPCASSPSPLLLPLGIRKTVKVAGGWSWWMVPTGMSEKRSMPFDAIQTAPSVNMNPPRTFSTSPRPIRGPIPVQSAWGAALESLGASPVATTQAGQRAAVARAAPVMTTPTMHFGIRMVATSVPTDGGDVPLLRDFQLDDTTVALNPVLPREMHRIVVHGSRSPAVSSPSCMMVTAPR